MTQLSLPADIWLKIMRQLPYGSHVGTNKEIYYTCKVTEEEYYNDITLLNMATSINAVRFCELLRPTNFHLITQLRAPLDVRFVIKSGRLDILKYLNLPRFPMDIILYAVKHNQTEILTYFLDNIQLPAQLGFTLIHNAVQFSSIETLEFLLARGFQLPNHILTTAVQGNRIDMLDYLRQFQPPFNDLINQSIILGNLPMVIRLIELKTPCNTSNLNCAIYNNRHEMINYLISKNIPYDKNSISQCVIANNIPLLRCILQQGFYQEWAYIDAITRQRMEAIEVLNEFHEVPSNVVVHGIHEDQLDISLRLIDLTPTITEEIFIAAIQNGNLDLINKIYTKTTSFRSVDYMMHVLYTGKEGIVNLAAMHNTAMNNVLVQKIIDKYSQLITNEVIANAKRHRVHPSLIAKMKWIRYGR